MKKLLLIPFFFISLLAHSQDTLFYDYGTATSVSGTIFVNSGSVTSGDTTVTTSYTSAGSAGVAPSGWPDGFKDYFYTEAADTNYVISTIKIGGSGFPWDTVNVSVFISRNFFTGLYNTVFINGDSVGTIDIGTNSTIYTYENIAITGDSIQIKSRGDGVAYAFLNAVALSEYQSGPSPDPGTSDKSPIEIVQDRFVAFIQDTYIKLIQK